MPSIGDISPESLEEFINNGGLSDLPNVESSSTTSDIIMIPVETKAITDVVVSDNVNDSTTRDKTGSPLLSSIDSENKEPEQKYHGDSKYAGDVIDTTPPPEKGYQTIDFETPAELVSYFDEHINAGTITLHEWQKSISKELACVDETTGKQLSKPTSLKPLKYCLVAANGSGKDAYVITPFVIWFLLTKIKSRVIITSASGTQLTAQTESYIRNLAEKVNEVTGLQIFRIRQRYIKCISSGSECRMFATDEAGKAEGYHPIEPNAEMAIIVNEGKSVSEEIHSALRRCTGYNYWLEVSTPGAPQGFFYRAATSWPKFRRVTSFDCPHLSPGEREQDKIDLGEQSALYRSKHLALFTSLDTECIITKETVDRLILQPPILKFVGWPKRVGIDLAAGGDENALCITQGAKCLVESSFIEKDTIVTAQRINDWLIAQGIPKEHKYINADDGGVGRAIIDNLVARGWRINRILNQSVAINRKQFGNRGAEMWYLVKRILEESLFDITKLSQKTQDQLCTRQYKQQNNGGRIFLESKKEAKANGRHSPDRADAFILCFAGQRVDDFLEGKVAEEDTRKSIQSNRVLHTSEEIYALYEDITFKQLEQTGQSLNGKKIRGSLRNALGITEDNNEITFSN